MKVKNCSEEGNNKLVIKKEQAAKKLEDLKHKFERIQQKKAAWVKLKPLVQMIPGKPPYLEEDPNVTMEYDLDDVPAHLAAKRKTKGERIKELQVKLQEILDMDDQKGQAQWLNEVVQDIAHVTKQVDVLKQKHKEAKKKEQQQQEQQEAEPQEEPQQEAEPQEEQQEAEPQVQLEPEPMDIEPFAKDQPAAASSSQETLHDPEMVARLASLKDSPHALPVIKEKLKKIQTEVPAERKEVIKLFVKSLVEVEGEAHPVRPGDEEELEEDPNIHCEDTDDDDDDDDNDKSHSSFVFRPGEEQPAAPPTQEEAEAEAEEQPAAPPTQEEVEAEVEEEEQPAAPPTQEEVEEEEEEEQPAAPPTQEEVEAEAEEEEQPAAPPTQEEAEEEEEERQPAAPPTQEEAEEQQQQPAEVEAGPEEVSFEQLSQEHTPRDPAEEYKMEFGKKTRSTTPLKTDEDDTDNSSPSSDEDEESTTIGSMEYSMELKKMMMEAHDMNLTIVSSSGSEEGGVKPPAPGNWTTAVRPRTGKIVIPSSDDDDEEAGGSGDACKRG